MELKDLQTEMQGAFGEMKNLVERQEAEIKKFGEASGETKAALDKVHADFDRMEAEIKKLQTRLNRPGTPGGEAGDEAAQALKGAFAEFVRKGEKAGPEALKALSVADDTTGGYLAPKEYVRDIIKNVTEFSPVRQLATVRTTTQRAIQIPKRTAQFSAAWVAEQGTRSETTGLAFGMLEIPNHELYAMVDISMQNLEDSAFNLEAELAAEFAEQFAVAEATAFVSGNAVGKPEGLLTNASVSETVSGAASAITADGLIAIFYDLKDVYARNATWVLKRSTLKAIRQLKDSQNQYLWQPGLAGGAPATILDRPYVEATDMPAVAANAYPVVFGDVRRAYTIVDRVNISILRDALTQATSGNVRFIARKRVGGQVVLPEAIRKMKIST